MKQAGFAVVKRPDIKSCWLGGNVLCRQNYIDCGQLFQTLSKKDAGEIVAYSRWLKCCIFSYLCIGTAFIHSFKNTTDLNQLEMLFASVGA